MKDGMGFVAGSARIARRAAREGACQRWGDRRQACVVQMGLFDGLKKAVGMGEDGKEGVVGVEERDEARPQQREEAERVLAGYKKRVDKINKLEDEIEKLSDEEMRERSFALRDAVQSGARKLDGALEEAFALVREAAFRTIGLRHYDVQLMGGMALNDGKIAEMATGEGKTLVCTLSAYLNALPGKGVCVVTVNDYLARRDAQLMGKIYRFLGLSVGLIQADMESDDRRKAYDCDITYVTNSEVGFDYLRDNLAMTTGEIVMSRPLNYCVIDEADSILIDEARTPLIISGKVDAPVKKYQAAQKIASFLENGVHYNVQEKQQGVTLTERGQQDCEQAIGGRDLFGVKDPWINFFLNALKAKEIFKKDINYIVDGDEVVIIDELTGRAMKGRRWGDGLHQAVECKEGIVIASETQTIASVSYQSFFSLFAKVSGMTGTALTEEKEFASIYGLPVLPIPTALPNARKDYPDAVFKNREGKVRSIMREIALEHTKGRPLLVGTTSLEDSEMFSALLRDVDCPHEVLNARPENVDRESEIIAQAGRKYAITIATNMAGRGTDIMLGGNPSYCALDALKLRVAQHSGEPFESRIGESASLTEEATARMDAAVAALVEEVPDITLSSAEALVSDDAGRLEALKCGAQLLEAYTQATDDFKEQFAEEKEDVVRLGGLYVIGTNRHESRRIDNQLRGRSGRQGDPGASRFFLGLDDGIFRVFGGERLQDLMTMFRVDENTPIENKQVTSALDGAQSNVESYYYDMRKLLWDYDQLLGAQRAKYYSVRREVVAGDKTAVSDRVLEMCLETARAILQAKGSDVSAMTSLLVQFFPTMDPKAISGLVGEDAESKLDKLVRSILATKESELEEHQEGFAAEIERYVLLQVMDTQWKQQLRDLDYLRQVIGVRSYGNMNPLDEYENEGFKLFTDMMDNISRNSVYSLFQYKVNTPA